MSYISELRKYIGHNPLICAGATVAVIKDKQILLNLRSDTITWDIPGGSLEVGETLEETAKRELKEERIISLCLMFSREMISILNIPTEMNCILLFLYI